MCKQDEVVLMKVAAENYRHRKTALLQHVGKEIVLRWSEEDNDLAFGEWTSDLRIAVIAKFIDRTQEFMLRFKCGYDKIVSCDALVELLEESAALLRAKKVKIVKSLREAKSEWTEGSMPNAISEIEGADEGTHLEKANDEDLEAALKHHFSATNAMEEEGKLARQRQGVFNMQQLEAMAARKLQDRDLALLQQQQDATKETEQTARERILFKKAQEQAMERINQARDAESATVEAAHKHSKEGEERIANDLALHKVRSDNAILMQMCAENAQYLRDVAPLSADLATHEMGVGNARKEDEERAREKDVAEQVSHELAKEHLVAEQRATDLAMQNMHADNEQKEEDERARAKQVAEHVANELAMQKAREENAQKEEAERLREKEVAEQVAHELARQKIREENALKEEEDRALAQHEPEQVAHELGMQKAREENALKENAERLREKQVSEQVAHELALQKTREDNALKEQAERVRAKQVAEHEAHELEMQKAREENALKEDAERLRERKVAEQVVHALAMQKTCEENALPEEGDPRRRSMRPTTWNFNKTQTQLK